MDFKFLKFLMVASILAAGSMAAAEKIKPPCSEMQPSGESGKKGQDRIWTSGWPEDRHSKKSEYNACLEKILPPDFKISPAQAAGIGCPNFANLSEEQKLAAEKALIRAWSYTETLHLPDFKHKATNKDEKSSFGLVGTPVDPSLGADCAEMSERPDVSLRCAVLVLKRNAATATNPPTVSLSYGMPFTNYSEGRQRFKDALTLYMPKECLNGYERNGPWSYGIGSPRAGTQ